MALDMTTLRDLMDAEYASLNATYAADATNRALMKAKLLQALAQAIVDHVTPELGGGGGSLTVRKNSGANVGTRARLNLIEGSNVTLVVTDDPGGAEIDVTISATSSAGTPASSVATETSYGQASGVGSSTDYARADHTHGTPSVPTAGMVGADPAGTAASAVAAHAGAADPHTGYQLESQKDAANGYAGLDAGGLLAPAAVPFTTRMFAWAMISNAFRLG